MTGQLYLGIYRSTTADDWPLLQTDKGFYELRCGGLAITQRAGLPEDFIELYVEVQPIKVAMSDSESIYLELQNGGCIVYGNTIINGDGTIEPGVEYLDPEEFDDAREEWYGTGVPLFEIKPF